MALSVDCYECGNELEETGALIFGPPDWNQRSKKLHLCRRCWGILFPYYDD